MGGTAEDAQGFAAPTAKSLRAAAEGRAHAVHLLLSRVSPRPAWVSAEWPVADFGEEPRGVSLAAPPSGSRQHQPAKPHVSAGQRSQICRQLAAECDSTDTRLRRLEDACTHLAGWHSGHQPQQHSPLTPNPRHPGGKQQVDQTPQQLHRYVDGPKQQQQHAAQSSPWQATGMRSVPASAAPTPKRPATPPTVPRPVVASTAARAAKKATGPMQAGLLSSTPTTPAGGAGIPEPVPVQHGGARRRLVFPPRDTHQRGAAGRPAGSTPQPAGMELPGHPRDSPGGRYLQGTTVSSSPVLFRSPAEQAAYLGVGLGAATTPHALGAGTAGGAGGRGARGVGADVAAPAAAAAGEGWGTGRPGRLAWEEPTRLLVPGSAHKMDGMAHLYEAASVSWPEEGADGHGTRGTHAAAAPRGLGAAAANQLYRGAHLTNRERLQAGLADLNAELHASWTALVAAGAV